MPELTQDKVIHDASSDRKYFATIPNIVIDEATPTELALYCHLKRICGEFGLCYVSRRNQIVKFKMDARVIKRDMASIVLKGWIIDQGKKRIAGHGQSVNHYSVADIWSTNMAQFKDDRVGGTNMHHLGGTDSHHSETQSEQGGTELHSIGGTKTQTKKNLYTKKINTGAGTPAQATEVKSPEEIQASKDTVDIIDAFEPVNPTYRKWYGNTTQRKSIVGLLADHGKDRVLRVIALLPKTNAIPYLPTITTPVQLEDKWAALAAGLVKEKSKLQAKMKPIIT